MNVNIVESMFQYSVFLSKNAYSCLEYTVDSTEYIIIFADSYDIGNNGSLNFYRISKVGDKNIKVPVYSVPADHWISVFLVNEDQRQVIFEEEPEFKYDFDEIDFIRNHALHNPLFKEHEDNQIKNNLKSRSSKKNSDTDENHSSKDYSDSETYRDRATETTELDFSEENSNPNSHIQTYGMNKQNMPFIHIQNILPESGSLSNKNSNSTHHTNQPNSNELLTHDQYENNYNPEHGNQKQIDGLISSVNKLTELVFAQQNNLSLILDHQNKNLSKIEPVLNLLMQQQATISNLSNFQNNNNSTALLSHLSHQTDHTSSIHTEQTKLNNDHSTSNVAPTIPQSAEHLVQNISSSFKAILPNEQNTLIQNTRKNTSGASNETDEIDAINEIGDLQSLSDTVVDNHHEKFSDSINSISVKSEDDSELLENETDESSSGIVLDDTNADFDLNSLEHQSSLINDEILTDIAKSEDNTENSETSFGELNDDNADISSSANTDYSFEEQTPVFEENDDVELNETENSQAYSESHSEANSEHLAEEQALNIQDEDNHENSDLYGDRNNHRDNSSILNTEDNYINDSDNQNIEDIQTHLSNQNTSSNAQNEILISEMEELSEEEEMMAALNDIIIETNELLNDESSLNFSTVDKNQEYPDEIERLNQKAEEIFIKDEQEKLSKVDSKLAEENNESESEGDKDEGEEEEQDGDSQGDNESSLHHPNSNLGKNINMNDLNIYSLIDKHDKKQQPPIKSHLFIDPDVDPQYVDDMYGKKTNDKKVSTSTIRKNESISDEFSLDELDNLENLIKPNSGKSPLYASPDAENQDEFISSQVLSYVFSDLDEDEWFEIDKFMKFFDENKLYKAFGKVSSDKVVYLVCKLLKNKNANPSKFVRPAIQKKLKAIMPDVAKEHWTGTISNIMDVFEEEKLLPGVNEIDICVWFVKNNFF